MAYRMLKAGIEILVRRTKNPSFKFDNDLTMRMMLTLIGDQLMYRLRALKLILRGRLTRNLQLGMGVRLKNLHNIKLGAGVKLSDYVLLDGLGVGRLSLGDGCSIGSYSRLIVSTSYSNLGHGINFGANVAIGEFSYIGGAGGVSIGKDTIVGQYLSIHPENHVTESKQTAIRFQGVTRRGVEVGNNVWIGSKVTILDGVSVGNGCVVCAGAVLTAGEYPAGSVIAGVPAKVMRQR